MRILAISLGTRETGVAVLRHGQLEHWQTHSFHGGWSDDKEKSILERCDRYIIEYRVEHVVIKIPPITHHTDTLLTLLKKLSDLVKYRGCMVACNTKADIKRMVPEVTNTETLMSYVTMRYPILLPEQHQELASRQPYHIKMFEAVLAAYVYRQEVLRNGHGI
jgi:RNase H-fold protein (predicted Holliday junction resolvase)